MRYMKNINVLIQYLKLKHPELDCRSIAVQNNYKNTIGFQTWCLRVKNMNIDDIFEMERLNIKMQPVTNTEPVAVNINTMTTTTITADTQQYFRISTDNSFTFTADDVEAVQPRIIHHHTGIAQIEDDDAIETIRQIPF